MLLIALLLFIAGIFNGECDTIAYHGSSKAWNSGIWWSRSNWTRELYIEAWGITAPRLLRFINSQLGWRLIKTVGNFTLDGWHLCKTIQLNCYYISIAMLLAYIGSLSWPTTIAVWLGCNLAHASGFQISFEDKLKL